jgi:hypothetical protein
MPALKPILGVRLVGASVDRIVERVKRAFRQVTGGEPGVGPIGALNSNGHPRADAADPHYVHVIGRVVATSRDATCPQSLPEDERLRKVTTAPVRNPVPEQLANAITFANCFFAGLFAATACDEDRGSEQGDDPDSPQ